MSRSPLSIDIETLRRVLDYDPKSGTFTWKIDVARNVKAGSSAGTVTQDGYLQIRLNKVGYKAHRLAFAHVHGFDPGPCIDHIDGDKLNNRIDNLRDASRSVNAQNRRTAKRGSAGTLLGAFLRARGGWESSILVNGRRVRVGVFRTEQEAHEAYLEKKRQLHEGCTL